MAKGGNSAAAVWFDQNNLGSFGNGMPWSTKYVHRYANLYKQQLREQALLHRKHIIDTLVSISPSIETSFKTCHDIDQDTLTLRHDTAANISTNISTPTKIQTQTEVSSKNEQAVKDSPPVEPVVIFYNQEISDKSADTAKNNTMSQTPHINKPSSSSLLSSTPHKTSNNPFAPKQSQPINFQKLHSLNISAQSISTLNSVQRPLHTQPISQLSSPIPTNIQSSLNQTSLNQNKQIQSSHLSNLIHEEKIDETIAKPKSPPASTPKTAEEEIDDIMNAFTI